LVEAIRNNHIETIDWWMRSKLPLKHCIRITYFDTTIFERLYEYNKILKN
jgi:hypothetical protein